MDSGGSVRHSECVPAMRGQWRGAHGAQVAPAGAAEGLGVAVEDLVPGAAAGHAQAVVLARHRREVADHQHRLAVARLAQEGDHAVVGVVGIDPFEAVAGEVELVQRGLAAVEPG